MMIARPLYTEKIMSFVDTPFVKILTGVHRCGKSTIMKMLIEELKNRGVRENQIIYYNFDLLVHEDLKNSNKLFRSLKENLSKDSKTYIFLDEIQEVESWEKVVNSLFTDYNVDIYVTGSSSIMMASELSTFLTGRYIQFSIYPLSFKEYLCFHKMNNDIDINAELTKYLHLGGFPSINPHNYSYEDTYTYKRDIFNSTIYKELVKRNGIRKIDQLERIVRFVFDK